jgi:tRNA threonylcarbamoyl adenosine modification protein YeaZ
MLDRIYSISVETITKNGSISIQKNGENVFISRLSSDESLSKSFVETISAVLKVNELSIADISFLATATGPGSFTSIRVAIATLSGLARSLNIPLIGVNFPDVIESFNYNESDALCILAGKTQIIYAKGKEEIETIDIAKLNLRIANCNKTLFRFDKQLLEIVSAGFETIPKNFILIDDICDAIGKIAYQRFKVGNLTPAIPQYLEFQNQK